MNLEKIKERRRSREYLERWKTEQQKGSWPTLVNGPPGLYVPARKRPSLRQQFAGQIMAALIAEPVPDGLRPVVDYWAEGAPESEDGPDRMAWVAVKAADALVRQLEKAE